MHCRRLLTAALVVLGVAGVDARPEADTRAGAARHDAARVSVHVTPGVAFAPANVRIVVRVPRHADNRALRVTVDSGAFLRSSEIPLDGAGAPAVHVLTWRALPAGEYEVTVRLYGTSRERDALHAPGALRVFE